MGFGKCLSTNVPKLGVNWAEKNLGKIRVIWKNIDLCDTGDLRQLRYRRQRAPRGPGGVGPRLSTAEARLPGGRVLEQPHSLPTVQGEKR